MKLYRYLENILLQSFVKWSADEKDMLCSAIKLLNKVSAVMTRSSDFVKNDEIAFGIVLLSLLRTSLNACLLTSYKATEKWALIHKAWSAPKLLFWSQSKFYSHEALKLQAYFFFFDDEHGPDNECFLWLEDIKESELTVATIGIICIVITVNTHFEFARVL